MGPHISERFGRNIPYAVCTLGLSAFTLGAAFSRTFTQLAVCRFFAGFFGGPSAVQIEGTFADVWPAMFTPSYYVFLMCAQYFGASVGAMIGYNVVPTQGWRWTQLLTLMVALAALLLGIGAPETYARRIMARQARRMGKKPSLPPAPTGVTIAEMATHTLINPVIMFFTQPLVTMITLYLSLNFGVLFSWFISVPFVLVNVYGFNSYQGGQAFATALAGTAVGALFAFIIDQVSSRIVWRRSGASPTVSFYSPIVGNGVYVIGSDVLHQLPLRRI
ncbi:hypothetical protein M1834_005420 [Neofusicoccum parvum]|nr:hypothetical protein M1834_005420 [Neofusicoccum parvum]